MDESDEAPREAVVQGQVMLAVGALPFVRLWRQNTGTAFYRDRSGRERVVRFGVPGGGDVSGILACGTRLELEVKSATGRQSADQRRFGDMITRMRGLYAVVRSVEQARAVLDKHLSGCTLCRER